MSGFECKVELRKKQTPYYFKTNKNSTLKGKNIVIIGGGMAGLSAALEASMMGAKVTILEAQNRLGGRMHSVKSSDVTLNMGANWVHDPVFNPVDEFITKLKMDKQIESRTTKYYYPKGQSPKLGIYSTDKHLPKEYMNIKPIIELYNDIEGTIEEHFESTLFWGVNPNTKYTIKPIIDQYCKEKNITLNWQTKGYFDNYINLADGLNLSEASFLDLDEKMVVKYSPWGASWLDQPLGGSDYAVKDYTKIIDLYKKELAKYNVDIQFGKYVTKVNYTNPEKTIVTCSDGANYSADHVISTLPAKVLEKNHKIFTPKLPDSLVDFTKKIQMAKWEKVAFIYDNKEELIPQNVSPEFHIYDPSQFDKGHIQIAATYTHVTKNQTAILCIIAADEVTKMNALRQKISEEKIKEKLFESYKFIAQKQGNSESIPTPKEIHVTDWTSNKHSLGAWSTQSQKGFQNRSAYYMNLFKKITFAGEAFHPTHPGTVHGAMFSGINSVLNIINVTSDKYNTEHLWGFGRKYSQTQEVYFSSRNYDPVISFNKDLKINTDNLPFLPNYFQYQFKKSYNVTYKIQSGGYRITKSIDGTKLFLYSGEEHSETKPIMTLRLHSKNTEKEYSYENDKNHNDLLATWAFPVEYDEKAGLKILPLLQLDTNKKALIQSGDLTAKLSIEILPMRSADYLAASIGKGQ